MKRGRKDMNGKENEKKGHEIKGQSKGMNMNKGRT